MNADEEARWVEVIRSLAPGLPDAVALPDGAVARLLERLSDRERMVLALRAGIGHFRERAWREVGAEIGTSHTRAIQIAAKARRKIRRWLVEELQSKAGDIIQALGSSEPEHKDE